MKQCILCREADGTVDWIRQLFGGCEIKWKVCQPCFDKFNEETKS